ncbi:MAG TPA: hypothetical protein DHL02_24535 [Achromobacter sp.]|nr:hypothetical protein [Achromobacter sp.]
MLAHGFTIDLLVFFIDLEYLLRTAIRKVVLREKATPPDLGTIRNTLKDFPVLTFRACEVAHVGKDHAIISDRIQSLGVKFDSALKVVNRFV